MKWVILNLCSQNGVARKKWQNIATMFKDDKIFVVEKAEDWERLPQWLLAQVKTPLQSVVAAGGDGTVHSVIQILHRLKLNAVLGMVGLGSSNDYHKPHAREGIDWFGKIPTRLQFEKAKPMDLLQFNLSLRGQVSEQWSALNASVGITANGNAIFNDPHSFASKLKGASVDLAITGAALQAYFSSAALSLQYSIDDLPAENASFVKLGIFKRSYFAGSFHYDEAPAVDDGKFGFARTKACSKWQQLKILTGLAQGQFSKLKGCELSFHHALKLQSQMPFVLEIDGETQTVDTVQVTVLPKAMLLCP